MATISFPGKHGHLTLLEGQDHTLEKSFFLSVLKFFQLNEIFNHVRQKFFFLK